MVLALDEALRPEVLPHAGGAVLQAAIGLASLFARGGAGERAAHRWFALSCAGSALWALASGVIIGAESPEVAETAARVAFVGLTTAGCASTAFAAALVGIRPRWLPLFGGVAALVAIACLLGPLDVRVRAGGGFWPRSSPLLLALVGVLLPAGGASLLLVGRAFFGQPRGRRRRRLGWALAAIAFGLLGGLDVRTLVGSAAPVEWVTGSLAALTQGYAMVQPRLLGAGGFLRQLGLSLVGGAAGAAVLLAALAIAEPGPITLLFALATVFLLARLWVGGVERWLDRLLERRRRRLERALLAFEEEALTARAPEEVDRILAAKLADGLDARVRGIYAPGALPGKDGATVEALLAGQPEPVVLDLLEEEGADHHAALALGQELGADAFVPVCIDGALAEVVALAAPSLRPAEADAPQELARFAERAARALVNARLCAEVDRRAANLEAEVHARTAALERALGELRLAQAQLLEVERGSSLGLLVAGVSHEINNALNVVTANLPTLGRYADAWESALAAAPQLPRQVDEARRSLPEALVAARHAARRTSALVSDLRRFARPETERRVVRVDEALVATLDFLRHRVDGHLTVGMLTQGTPTVEGYPGPLNQALFSLLLNAVEAADSEIWVEVREREEGRVELLIRDDGPGLSDEVERRAFEPFFSTKPRATGLGLALCRRVVERHGGQVALARRSGGGAIARVELPARAPDPAATAEGARA